MFLLKVLSYRVHVVARVQCASETLRLFSTLPLHNISAFPQLRKPVIRNNCVRPSNVPAMLVHVNSFLSGTCFSFALNKATPPWITKRQTPSVYASRSTALNLIPNTLQFGTGTSRFQSARRARKKMYSAKQQKQIVDNFQKTSTGHRLNINFRRLGGELLAVDRQRLAVDRQRLAGDCRRRSRTFDGETNPRPSLKEVCPSTTWRATGNSCSGWKELF